MSEPRWVPRSRSDWLLVAGIVLAAFLVRAVPVLRGGGLEGYLGYDDGVYFAAAAALVDGVLPYRDFLLLHPPGIALLLSPFALIAGATDGATGFALARLAFMVIGALNAGLVTLVAGRYGRRAALVSGILYAMWYAASRAERTTILIGPQTTLLLVAVLILLSGRRLGVRRAALAGVCLGAAMAIQVWAVVPVAVVAVALLLGWLGVEGDRRRAAIGLLGGSAAALGAICLPFFVAAPGGFIRYVLIDQLARPSLDVGLVTRLRVLEGFSRDRREEPGRHRRCHRARDRGCACGRVRRPSRPGRADVVCARLGRGRLSPVRTELLHALLGLDGAGGGHRPRDRGVADPRRRRAIAVAGYDPGRGSAPSASWP